MTDVPKLVKVKRLDVRPVTLRFIAEDMKPGEQREVHALPKTYEGIELFRLHDLDCTSPGTWWLDRVMTDGCKQLLGHVGFRRCPTHGDTFGADAVGLCNQLVGMYKYEDGWRTTGWPEGHAFHPKHPMSSGTTMPTCTPSNIVLVVTNRGTESATMTACLYGRGRLK